MTQQEAKFAGCLMGAAIGNALGAPFIGKTTAEIAEHGPILDFAPSPGLASVVVPVADMGLSEVGEALGPGQWTEDTQLMLALAETLIEEGGLLIPEAWGHKLVRWVNDAPRLPDISTLQAALQMRTGGVFWDESADPEGAGCGPAARVAPIGLLYARDPIQRRRNAVTQAQVTHGDPDAQAASLAVAEAVSLLLSLNSDDRAHWNGGDFLAALAEAVEREAVQYLEFARCLRLAETLFRDQVERATAIRVLGVSDWAREAVPCALYCVASGSENFETLMLQTLEQTGGAAASIAAITGAVGGAYHGVEAIPERWRKKVEGANRLLETAHTLYSLA